MHNKIRKIIFLTKKGCLTGNYINLKWLGKFFFACTGKKEGFNLTKFIYLPYFVSPHILKRHDFQFLILDIRKARIQIV